MIASKFLKRGRDILTLEGVEFSDRVVAELIMRNFPDFRKTLNELQRYSSNGKIDAGVLAATGDIGMDVLVKALKTRNFNEIRRWVVENGDKDTTHVFRKIYDGLQESLTTDSIPQAVLVLADYQYKAAFAADQEINLTACLISLAADCAFKT